LLGWPRLMAEIKGEIGAEVCEGKAKPNPKIFKLSRNI